MSLQYNVATLLQEPIGATRAYEIDDRALIDESGPTHRRVAGQATFLRTRHGVLVSAKLRADHTDECARCLRQLDVPVSIEIEEEFIDRTTPPEGGHEGPVDPDTFVISAQHMLDLEEPVRQYWNLNLPMQPLCRPDCKGLCPRCGRDWNEGTCSCGPEVDERWSALRELVKQQEGS